MKRIFLLLILTIISTRGNALPLTKLEYGKLSNGLKIYVIQNKRIPAVVHMLLYRVGSTNDPVGKTGLAHFLEHLMFRGTKEIKNPSAFLKSLGARYNAMTSKDYTSYFTLVAKDKLPAVMRFEADRMRNLTLKKKFVVAERKIVTQERKMRIDNNASNRLNEMILACIPNSAVNRPTAGWSSEIAGLTKRDARKFYKTFYSPNNAILLIVGDTQLKEIVPMAEKYYGKIKSKTLLQNKVLQIPPIQLSDEIKYTIALINCEIHYPDLSFWYVIPDITRKYLAVRLGTDILAGDEASFLYKKLVVDKKIATEVEIGYNDIINNTGILSIHFTAKPEVNLLTLQKAAEDALNEFVKRPINKNDFVNSRNVFKADFIYSQEALLSQANLYGDFLIHGMDVRETTEKLDTISMKEVHEVMRKILLQKRKIIGHLLPKTYVR